LFSKIAGLAGQVVRKERVKRVQQSSMAVVVILGVRPQTSGKQRFKHVGSLDIAAGILDAHVFASRMC
jgi:hypothetical protein